MKKTNAIILLLSILIGTFQPVTPIADHLIVGKSLTEVFNFTEFCHNDSCPLKGEQTNKDCSCCDYEGLELLDTDFYPVPVKTTPNPTVEISTYSTVLCVATVEGLTYLHYPPAPPPPRQS